MGGHCVWVKLEATQRAVGAATAVRVLFSVDWNAMLIDTSQYSALVASSNIPTQLVWFFPSIARGHLSPGRRIDD